MPEPHERRARPGTVKPAILNLVEQSSGVKIPETFKAVSAERWLCASTTPELRLPRPSSTWCASLWRPARSPQHGRLDGVQFHAVAASALVLLRVSLALVGRDGSDEGSDLLGGDGDAGE
jgi:hypothetical protein